MTTFQGDPYNLQGNGAVLQGSGQPGLNWPSNDYQNPQGLALGFGALQDGNLQFQGAGVPLQGSGMPVAAPIAATVAPTAQNQAVVAPKVAPAVTDLSGKYANVGGTIYDKATGQGFSTPQQFFQAAGVNSFNGLKYDTAWTPGQVQQPAEQQYQQPSLDSNQQLAQSAGQAGMSVADYQKLFAASPQERQAIYDQLGIPAAEQAAYSAPSKSTQQIYNDAYNASGLADVKTKLTDLQAKIDQKNTDLNTALGSVNENPWLSEASRVGRAKNLQTLAQGEIANLTSQYNELANTFTQGLSEVNNVVTNTSMDFSNNQKLNQAKLTYLEGQAAQQVTDTSNAKLARYMPDYMSALSSKPTVVASGGTLVDPKTGKIIYQAPVKLSAGNTLVDQASGTPLYTAPKATSGTSASGFSVTSTGSGTAMDASIANDVEAVMSGRNTLYNIRQTMGRTNAAAAYMQSMRDAITKQDPNFDFVASDAGGKFVSSTFYQKAISAITSVEPNIDVAVDLSNQVQRIGVAAMDKVLQAGQIQIGNVKVANFHEAQKLIADEIGLALGQGSVSDMKLQLGMDVTDPSVSPEVFASNMALVKQFILNRKQALIDQRYSSPTAAGVSQTGQAPATIEDAKAMYGISY